METVGYAALQIVPSVKGIEGKLSSQLGGPMSDAGKHAGGGFGGSFLGAVGGAMAGLGAIAAGGAVKSFVSGSVAAFSELEDSTAAAGVVFGDSMNKIIEQSKTASSTLGLSSQEVINAANTYGTYGKAAGLSGDALAKFSTDFTGLAADMASFKGTSPEQAIQAIGSALRGEAEPIRAYGVMLDDASLKQEAMAQGLITSTKEALTPQNKILAAQALIFKQTKDAQGDFSRTSMSTANVAKTLAAESENLSAKFGSSLAPAFTAVRLGAIQGVRAMSAALDTIGPIIANVSQAVINGISGLKDLILKGDITPAFLKAFGVEEDAPIIGVLIRTREILVDGIAGISAILFQNDFTPAMRTAFHVEEDSAFVTFLFTVREKVIEAFEGIRNFVAGFTLPRNEALKLGLEGDLGGMVEVGVKVRDILNTVFGGIKDLVAGFTLPRIDAAAMGGDLGGMVAIGSGLRDVFDGIVQAVGPLIPYLVQLWTSLSPVNLIFQAIQPHLPLIVDMFGQLASVIGGSLVSVLTAVVPSIMELSATAQVLFQGVLAAVLPVVVQLIGMLGTTMAQVLPIITGIFNQLVGLGTELITALMPIILQLVTTVMPMVVTIFGAVLEAIGPVISMIAGLLMPIIQALMPVVVTVFGVIADVIGSVMQIIMGVIQVVTGIISGNWSQVWEGIQNIFGGIWNTIVNVLSGVLQIIWSVITSVFGLVWGFISGILGNIFQFFADTWNNIVNAVTGAVAFIWNGISEGINNVWNFIQDVLGNIGRFFSETWDNITRGVSGFIDGFLGFFRDLPDKIMGFLSGAGEWLVGIGKNLIDGLVSGVQNMAGSVAKAILNVLPEAIRGPIETVLGIRSPSTVAMWWMEMIGAGFIKQAPTETRRIKGVMNHLLEDATGTLSLPAIDGGRISRLSGAQLAGGPGATQTSQKTEINFNGPVYGDPEHIVDAMEARKRRAATLSNLRTITAGV